MNKLKPVHLLLFTLAFINGHAQKPFEAGVEYMRVFGRGYSGNIAGPRVESFNNKSSYSFGLTYHFSSKKSYSGSRGFGAYAGYRYAFNSDINSGSPYLGARVLFSFENFDGKTSLNSLFFTPMAEAGYHFLFGKSLFAAPGIAYGYSLKITREYNSLDEDVGQRIIPSISTGIRF